MSMPPQDPEVEAAIRYPCYHTLKTQPRIPRTGRTTEIEFTPLFNSPQLSWSNYRRFEQFQTITFQYPFQHYSVEELRLADYFHARVVRDVEESFKELAITPLASTSILSLPEDVIIDMTKLLSTDDIRAFRLANPKLAQASSYTLAQRVPSEINVPMTESWLTSLLMLSRNHSLCRRISTIRLDALFVNPASHAPDLEHTCQLDSKFADCPVRIQEGLNNGASEVHTRLLRESISNLKNLKRVELRARIAPFHQENDGEPLPAWYPMSLWPFKSVVAAMQAADTQVLELHLKEWGAGLRGMATPVLPLGADPSPPPCELSSMPFLRSLGLHLEHRPEMKLADRHSSMFRHMRAILVAAAGNLKSLSIKCPGYEREATHGLLGAGIRFSKLQFLSLVEVKVTFQALKDFLVAHASTLKYIELDGCAFEFGDAQAMEIDEILEQQGISMQFACSQPGILLDKYSGTPKPDESLRRGY